MASSRPTVRPTSWWLERLRRRAKGMYDEKLDLSQPIPLADEAERDAAIRFFNAAYRSEESGLRQAHALAEQLRATDPELAEALELYGNEEGWHRELLTEFLAHLGGEVRPMGTVTSTFYKLYARAERMDTILLTNLMFETIGSTTYRLALRHAEHDTVRQLLAILTRDEAFHVPLNVHFLREVLRRQGVSMLRLRVVYNLLFVALVLSTVASRRRAQKFDKIPLGVLARAYAEHLAGLFLHERDLKLTPPIWLLRVLGVDTRALAKIAEQAAISVEAAAASADRERVVVAAL
jgi:hypothetical protein